ncbi:histidine phosphatase family protein [Sphingomonas sp.]|uniref:SixA phosphatase family protein n=1 Tax=Sphingomonas sp. TaxID=28214 RepID=UPI00286DCCE1|nr:histidine phosphatase family protein [Sphingomonas sp.]
MKRLLILRHAKSPAAPELRDFDRPLNDVGRAAAEALGRELLRLGVEFDSVIASPARRVTDTLDHLAIGLARTLAPRFDRSIYNADTGTLLDLVRAADDAASALLLVGHNPGLAILARMLAADDGTPDSQSLSAKFSPGTLAEISFAADQWQAVGEGGGRLVRVIRPSDLAR